MFTYVKLKNYKSLVDFEVDLTDSKNNPKKNGSNIRRKWSGKNKLY